MPRSPFFSSSDPGGKTKEEIAATDVTVDGELCWKTLDYKQHIRYNQHHPFSGNMHVLAVIQLAHQHQHQHQQHAPSMYESAHKSKKEEKIDCNRMHLYYNNRGLFDSNRHALFIGTTFSTASFKAS